MSSTAPLLRLQHGTEGAPLIAGSSLVVTTRTGHSAVLCPVGEFKPYTVELLALVLRGAASALAGIPDIAWNDLSAQQRELWLLFAKRAYAAVDRLRYEQATGLRLAELAQSEGSRPQ